MFQTIDGLVDRMRRGDSLTVIPITGNAMSETPGRILHFSAPTERQAYDHDLAVFRQESHRSLNAMQDFALTHPSKRTDILGTLDVAKQEFEASPPGNRRSLIVMSDYLEDDGVYRFTSDKALADVGTVQTLADHLQKEHALALRDVHVLLEAIQSKDLRSLGPNRQHTVWAFWKTYFAPTAAVEIQIDGIQTNR